MLPRLRFVFAAAFIAALPWLLIGSGVVTTAQNTPTSDYTRAGSGVALATGDLRDAHHMHALAYVRRSRELERLRELGSAPLSDWVASPVGIPVTDAPVGPGDQPVQVRAAPSAIPEPAANPPPETTVVASLPPEPAMAPEPAAPAPLPPAVQEPISQQPVAPVSDETVQASEAVEPDFSNVDWSQVVPPLPRAKPDGDKTRNANRRARAKRSQFYTVNSRPAASPVNPFGGPPASPTSTNPARYGFQQ